ncbi:hypothetical protein BV20DRAFT_279262 [Pilatotrama ljubarskyi]|nr:hypothetical protein BV20DRAFT_279262 [Pilatotrama ljubarskyi]
MQDLTNQPTSVCAHSRVATQHWAEMQASASYSSASAQQDNPPFLSVSCFRGARRAVRAPCLPLLRSRRVATPVHPGPRSHIFRLAYCAFSAKNQGLRPQVPRLRLVECNDIQVDIRVRVSVLAISRTRCSRSTSHPTVTSCLPDGVITRNG